MPEHLSEIIKSELQSVIVPALSRIVVHTMEKKILKPAQQVCLNFNNNVCWMIDWSEYNCVFWEGFPKDDFGAVDSPAWKDPPGFNCDNCPKASQRKSGRIGEHCRYSSEPACECFIPRMFPAGRWKNGRGNSETWTWTNHQWLVDNKRHMPSSVTDL